MASKTDKQRILTGGMQLLSPVDKVPQGSSTLLENFRIDQGDELRSRFGTRKELGAVGAGTFHTLRRTANDRYLGIGTSLWYHEYGAAAATEIVTGLDARPVGLAFYRNAGWMMNASKQKKLKGLTVVPWCPSTPATAPIATGGGQITKVVEEFDSGAAGDINVGVNSPPAGAAAFTSFAMQNGVPVAGTAVTADFDTNNKQSGSGSLRLAIASATSATAYVSLSALDSSIDGDTQDTDILRVWVFCSNPAAIDSITVYVKTGAPGAANGGYAEFTFSPAKFLNQALNSWTQLKIRRRLNVDDWSQRIAAAADGNQQTVSDLEARFATELQTPTFVYTGSGWPQTGIGQAPPATWPPSQAMLNVNWLNVTELGVTFKANDAVNVGLDLMDFAGTVGENSSGSMQYYVSFENTDGEDGNPGPASNAVIAGTQTITLTGIPVSPDTNIAFRRIWRIGGGLNSALLVDKIAGNVSTGPWVDQTTNRKAQADNVQMPTDHDPPPAAKGVVGPFFGKLVAYNTALHKARIFWTPAGQPWFFRGANDEFLGDWEDCGGDDDEILTATDHKLLLLIYKRRSIWRLAGDPQNTDPVKTNASVSAMNENCVANAGGLDYFLGYEGAYRFNGDFEEKISQAIDPIFKGDYVQVADGEFLPPMSLDVNAIKNYSIAVVGDRLRISYAEAPATLPNVVAVMHIPTGRWAREKYNLAAPAFTAMVYEGPGFLMMAGATGAAGGGYLYNLELQGNYKDDGNDAIAKWQSAFYDQGLPDNNKVYTDVEIDCQTSSGLSPNAVLTVYLVVNNGTKIALGTITGNGSYDKPRFTGIIRIMNAAGTDVGYTAKNAAIRIESDSLATIVIYGVYLHWYPEERVARSWDTGPTDLGIPERVKEVDYCEFYLTASGQSLRRVISSDLPGSLLTHRDDANLTAPNGRGNVRFRLGAQIDGRNWRMWLGDNPSGATFQVHQARARMRPIGEYIDGTLSPIEFYESPEFSVAPGRVGELKDLLLDYDATGGQGNGRLEIYTDLPTNALALYRTIALPNQSRAPRMLPFEAPALAGPGGGSTLLPYGQLFKIRIYPPTGGILRLHGRATIRARIIGVYFDGTRGEIWDTQPLDLLGGMTIYRELAIVCQAEGPMWLEFRTELPGQNMATVSSFRVVPSATTPGRLPFIGRLPGSAKGRLCQVRLVGPYVARVFEAKVYSRRVQSSDTPWDWIPIPVEVTPDAFHELNMPVRATPEEFTWVDLAADPIE